ncbi:acetylornithine deacetylase or succinyl-diaminopimelate desuccinylase [Methanococcus maripaludis C5]|uniref:Acetylornithine deacetylase or succinyl-diaminopimelate desuccinylase n=1 Tax=Methanococcus maripaludis (strain C5 / ATCC BAA-1333) TaxID=402880 RepID=A4FWC2_METM5|nr:M20 family metallo-hydrolase [Methanococcus maripaludis]ABO34497.1 acetylornithine deacetylase or succinyl-diaminopimelate desuccinylase [Methanococcus maripaludis C5]
MKSILDETIEISSDLIAINSVNPTFGGVGEKEKSIYIKNKLKEYHEKYSIKNCKISEYNTIDSNGIERPNIVSKYDFGKDTSLTIISHMDIVPEGDFGLWNSDPFKAEIKDGIIYGRGSEDNHKGIVSSFLLLKMIFEEKIYPKYNLNLIFVSDEEDGSEYGLSYLVNNFKNELFDSKDLIIVPDFGMPEGEFIEIAEKNILWLNFKIKGKQCHGSTPENGFNADVMAFSFGKGLYDTLYNKYSELDSIFNPPFSTFEPTILRNNVENTNTIPGYVELNFDCRIIPKYDPKEVLVDIENYIEDFKNEIEKHVVHFDISEKENISIEYEILKLEKTEKTKTDSEVVEKLGSAIKNVLNKEPVLCGMGGGTVAAFLREKKYNVAVWGIGYETAHQPNEHIKIEHLIQMAEIYLDILK